MAINYVSRLHHHHDEHHSPIPMSPCLYRTPVQCLSTQGGHHGNPTVFPLQSLVDQTWQYWCVFVLHKDSPLLLPKAQKSISSQTPGHSFTLLTSHLNHRSVECKHTKAQMESGERECTGNCDPCHPVTCSIFSAATTTTMTTMLLFYILVYKLIGTPCSFGKANTSGRRKREGFEFLRKFH